MRSNPATQKLNHQVEAHYLRQILTALILLAVLFVVVGFVVLVTRAQHPNCVDLKKRLDDAARAYQTVLIQSQTIDKNYLSYQSTVNKIQGELIANNKRRELTERDIAAAQSDRARCDRDPAVLAAGACANVTHRMDTAERRLTYFRTNAKRLEADLLVAQQRLASTRTTLGAANANLTAAQQDLDDANKAYTAAGCANDK